MLRQIIAICILDSEGERLAVRYFNKNKQLKLLDTYSSQIQFERKLMQKTSKMLGRGDVEILSVDDYIILFRSIQDLCIFIIGGANENEILLLDVMSAVIEGLNTITRGHVGKKQALENLDYVFLMIDEIVDEGIVFEVDPAVIHNRLNMSEVQEATDLTPFNQAISLARDNIMRNFLNS